MDSVTQFALGATIGAAVMGRRVGLRRAALTGGLLATLPDLDVFWPEEDPIERFVTHRSATHSLIMHILVTPLIGEALRRFSKPLKDLPWRQGVTLAWGVVFLCLTTHALLDATTIYGTQLLWPLTRTPYAIGSMFIIDPLYTLPLLIITIWALWQNSWNPRFVLWLKVSLAVSSLYLGWSFVAQDRMADKGGAVLADAGLKFEQLIASPTPLNTSFWRIIAVDGARYYNIYLSVLGGPEKPAIYQHVRYGPGAKCWLESPDHLDAPVQRLARFSHGFNSLKRQGDDLVHADLRMGMTPYYVFRYKVAEGAVFRPADPTRMTGPRNGVGDWPWLWAGMRGQVDVRPDEKASQIFPQKQQDSQQASKAPDPKVC